ncbi:unnamed protein product [Allacma fusca]|uniref:Ionotropic receptor n=1 Tax=Allacma fusca TaxID=39272 RepID=A0A8J2K863_9HEXA|nr:unnamed protein product [Allacma fusca]
MNPFKKASFGYRCKTALSCTFLLFQITQQKEYITFDLASLALKSFLEILKTNFDSRIFEVKLTIPEILMTDNVLKILETHYYSTPKTIFSMHRYIKFDPPIIPDYRSALQKKHYLAHQSLQIFQVTYQNSASLLKFLETLVYLGEPHRDRFVFFGEDKVLLEFLHSEIMFQLKYKFGIFKTGSVLKDPDVYKGGKMVISSDPPRFHSKWVNMSGRRLTISAYPNPPYIYIDKKGEFAGGAHYNILYFMGLKYNYTMDVDHVTPEGTGYYKNGMWNGMTGDTYYRRSDVGLFMGITADRYGLIDTVFLQPDVVYFMTRQPEAHDKWQAMFFPYTPVTWLAIFIAYFAFSATLYFLLSIGKVENKGYHTAFIPYQISLGQGFDIELPTQVKFITAIFMFFMIVSNTGYQSDLVSWLAFPELEVIPRDFPSLDKRKEYKVVFNFHAGTSYHYFNNAKSGVIKNVRKRFILEHEINMCVIWAAMEKSTVCISWGLLMPRAIGSNLTLPGAFKPMVVLSEPAVTFPIGFAFPRNSIFTDTFEVIAKYLRDSGLIRKWNLDVYAKYTSEGKSWMKSQRDGELFTTIDAKWKEIQASVRPFKFENVAAPFAIWAVCLLISAIGYGAEIVYAQKQALHKMALHKYLFF